MILKIVYAPLCAKYFLNVKEINFISCLSDKALKVCFKPDGKKLVENIELELYTSKEYLKNEVGCNIFDDNQTYYLNTVDIAFEKEGNKQIAYTGNAYLCDDSGKTVDTLR